MGSATHPGGPAARTAAGYDERAPGTATAAGGHDRRAPGAATRTATGAARGFDWGSAGGLETWNRQSPSDW